MFDLFELACPTLQIHLSSISTFLRLLDIDEGKNMEYPWIIRGGDDEMTERNLMWWFQSIREGIKRIESEGVQKRSENCTIDEQTVRIRIAVHNRSLAVMTYQAHMLTQILGWFKNCIIIDLIANLLAADSNVSKMCEFGC